MNLIYNFVYFYREMYLVYLLNNHLYIIKSML